MRALHTLDLPEIDSNFYSGFPRNSFSHWWGDSIYQQFLTQVPPFENKFGNPHYMAIKFLTEFIPTSPMRTRLVMTLRDAE